MRVGRRINQARRLGWVLALILTGYAAISRSLATTFADSDPELSLAFDPDNAAGLGGSAERIAVGLHDKASGARSRSMAQRAISLDPTAVSAVVALALSADDYTGSSRADRLFEYSQSLSRRDLPTQLYFIERAVSKRDVTDTLHHYDIALRGSDSAQKLLFPILLGAISEPELRRALVRTLRQNPIWAGAFVIEASLHAPDFLPVAYLFSDLRSTGFQVLTVNENSLLVNLVAKGDFSTAWRYYKVMFPSADRFKIRNGQFSDDLRSSSVFDWAVGDDDGISASIDTADGRGALEFSTASTSAGVIAQQLLVLSPGSYRLSTVAGGIAQERGSGPYWELSCAGGIIAGTLEIGATGAGVMTFSQMIIVPSGCNAQWLRLRSRPTDDVQGLSGRVTAVVLSRINER